MQVANVETCGTAKNLDCNPGQWSRQGLLGYRQNYKWQENRSFQILEF